MELSNDPETQAGLATRRKVLGNDYVQAALDRVTPFTAPLQELVRNMRGATRGSAGEST